MNNTEGMRLASPVLAAADISFADSAPEGSACKPFDLF